MTTNLNQMSEEEREELRSTLDLLRCLHRFHNKYEGKLGMSEDESIEHRLNIMEEIDRIIRLLRDDDDQRDGMNS